MAKTRSSHTSTPRSFVSIECLTVAVTGLSGFDPTRLARSHVVGSDTGTQLPRPEGIDGTARDTNRDHHSGRSMPRLAVGGSGTDVAERQLGSRCMARSPRVTIPTARPSSTTGMRRNDRSLISRTASSTLLSGATVVRLFEHAWSIVASAAAPSARQRTTRSRSVTIRGQSAAFPGDEDVADLAVAHQSGCIGDGRCRGARDKVGAHYVQDGGSHGVFLPVCCWCCSSHKVVAYRSSTIPYPLNINA